MTEGHCAHLAMGRSVRAAFRISDGTPGHPPSLDSGRTAARRSAETTSDSAEQSRSEFSEVPAGGGEISGATSDLKTRRAATIASRSPQSWGVPPGIQSRSAPRQSSGFGGGPQTQPIPFFRVTTPGIQLRTGPGTWHGPGSAARGLPPNHQPRSAFPLNFRDTTFQNSWA